MPILPHETACLACVYPQPPAGSQPTCETAGVLNPVTSIVASLQCAEATKILAGACAIQPDHNHRSSGAVSFARYSNRREIPLAVPAHKAISSICKPGTERQSALCGRNAVQIHERMRPLDLVALRRQLEPLGDVRANEFALRFFPAPYEMTVFPDGRAIIKGTTDIGIARSLYARYVGA